MPSRRPGCAASLLAAPCILLRRRQTTPILSDLHLRNLLHSPINVAELSHPTRLKVHHGVAERIRNGIGSSHFTTERDRITASVGYASFPSHSSGREELVDKAEWARRRAKRLGRDTAVAFAPQAD